MGRCNWDVALDILPQIFMVPEFKVPARELQKLIEQSDRDIADHVMAMDAIMADEPCAVQDWQLRREYWMGQISRG